MNIWRNKDKNHFYEIENMMHNDDDDDNREDIWYYQYWLISDSKKKIIFNNTNWFIFMFWISEFSSINKNQNVLF